MSADNKVMVRRVREEIWNREPLTVADQMMGKSRKLGKLARVRPAAATGPIPPLGQPARERAKRLRSLDSTE
jgi:hypothetical protein